MGVIQSVPHPAPRPASPTPRRNFAAQRNMETGKLLEYARTNEHGVAVKGDSESGGRSRSKTTKTPYLHNDCLTLLLFLSDRSPGLDYHTSPSTCTCTAGQASLMRSPKTKTQRSCIKKIF